MTKKSCNLILPSAHNWLETTKSDSLRCYLPLMTNSIKKLRNQMILFKEIVDQRILQSNLTSGLTDHTQSKVVVSNTTWGIFPKTRIFLSKNKNKLALSVFHP